MNVNLFEKKLTEYFNKLCKSEKCYFFKSPTPTIMRKTANDFQLFYSSKAICDFIGIFNGHFILIEAKSISGKYWRKDRLKNHQIEQLKLVLEKGGKSFLFLEILQESKIVVFEINAYLNMLHFGKNNYIPVEKLIIYGQSTFTYYENEVVLFFKSIFLD